MALLPEHLLKCYPITDETSCFAFPCVFLAEFFVPMDSTPQRLVMCCCGVSTVHPSEPTASDSLKDSGGGGACRNVHPVLLCFLLFHHACRPTSNTTSSPHLQLLARCAKQGTAPVNASVSAPMPTSGDATSMGGYNRNHNRVQVQIHSGDCVALLENKLRF